VGRLQGSAHSVPGKGGAFVAIEAKALREGNKLQERFRSGETIEQAHIEAREATFLFKDDTGFTFMDKENYEQLHRRRRRARSRPVALAAGRHGGDGVPARGLPVGVELPKSVLAVLEADAVVKGQTASSSYKPAVVEGGIRVMVPPHIAVGTKLVISTEDGSYLERAKD
jgi:elongation factor P